MFNGNRQTLDELVNFPFFILTPTFLKSNTRETKSLLRAARTLDDGVNISEDAEGISAQDFGKYKVELHKRIVSPILGFGFAMAGLACLYTAP